MKTSRGISLSFALLVLARTTAVFGQASTYVPELGDE
jgi:hypothetical protein